MLFPLMRGPENYGRYGGGLFCDNARVIAIFFWLTVGAKTGLSVNLRASKSSMFNGKLSPHYR